MLPNNNKQKLEKNIHKYITWGSINTKSTEEMKEDENATTKKEKQRRNSGDGRLRKGYFVAGVLGEERREGQEVDVEER